ncbi:MAG TPA: cbb3-type cytochrome c oxidase subunit I [Stenomitos sp.]
MNLSDEPLDLEARLRLDESGKVAARFCFTSAVLWLLIGTLFAVVASFKFEFPDWLQSWGPTAFGRVRPAHLNAMIYGWASLAMLGESLWLVPRLVHVPLKWPKVALVGAWIWNIGLAIGIITLLGGRSDGLEWLEMDRYWVVPWLVVGGGCVGASILYTVVSRKVQHLYVSVWYIASSFVWFPIIYVTGNYPFYHGVESGAANWFYAHNALGFWLTAINLGAIYYFIPKILGRPIYSYQLSLLGFWTLSFFYALNGMHHLVGAPLPTWMIATSIVASVLMVIPVGAVAVNHHMTMVGRFRALRFSPALRFIVLGAMAYTAVSLQGTFTALPEVNRTTHFTHWTIAHSHMGVYAFVTLVLFGAMYYIVPRLVQKDWPRPALIGWHFWLVFIGIILYIVSLSFGGVFQGLAMLDPTTPFQASVDATIPYLWARSISGIVLAAGHLVFAYHYWLMIQPRPHVAPLPPWHEPKPTLVEPEATP